MEGSPSILLLVGLVGSANAPIKMGQIAVLSESEHGDSFTMKAKSDQGKFLSRCMIIE